MEVGRTHGELDTLFAEKVPARKFKSTVVNQFHSESGAEAANDVGRDTVVDYGVEKKASGSEQQWVEKKLPGGEV